MRHREDAGACSWCSSSLLHNHFFVSCHFQLLTKNISNQVALFSWT